MSTYRVADTFDVALGSLTVLSPQPRSDGTKPTRRNYAADGTISDDARYAELEWDVIETAAAYLALLTTFGLHNALTNEVTLYLRDETFAFVRVNAIVHRPELGRDAGWNIFARNVTILATNIVAAA